MGHPETRRSAPSSAGRPARRPRLTPATVATGLLPGVHRGRLSAGRLCPLWRPLRQPLPAARVPQLPGRRSACRPPHRLLCPDRPGPKAAHRSESGQRQVCPDRAGQTAASGINNLSLNTCTMVPCI